MKKKKFYGHPMFYKILRELAELHSSKNHDYAGEQTPLRNFLKAKDMGIEPWKGVLIRLTDKMSRLESFARKESFMVKDESVIDTLRDIAVYAILAIILYVTGKKNS